MELIFNNKKNQKDILMEANGKISYPQDDSLLIFGDNFNVMGNLLNNYKNKIDLVYIDPPFNTNQTFSIGERANAISKERKGETAYFDFMDDDEFMGFMYKRFILIHELLSNEGSLYVHIDCKMGHYFKVLLDEIFGKENFKNDIARIKSNPKNFERRAYGNEKDMLLFYSKNHKENIWNNVKNSLTEDDLITRFSKVSEDGRRFTTVPVHAPGETLNGATGAKWKGRFPPKGRHWRCSPKELDELDKKGLILWSSTGNPRIIKYANESDGKKIQDVWTFKDPQNPLYPTQKNLEMLKLIVMQSSNPNSTVLDCFCGSGSTLVACSFLKRKFIGIDKSKVALKIAEKRLKDIKADFKLIDNGLKKPTSIQTSKTY